MKIKRRKKKQAVALDLTAAFKLAEKVDPMLVELMVASLQRNNKAIRT